MASIASFWNNTTWVDFTAPTASTTTTGSVDGSGASEVIAFNDTTGFSANQVIKIDDEFFTITSFDGNNVTCARAANGSSAATHSSGATIIGFSADAASALINFQLTDTIGMPTESAMTIINESPNPFSSSGKGAYSGILGNFTPLKVRDADTNQIYFYGVCFDIREEYNAAYGMVLELQAYDYLFELRDNSTRGAYSYKINTAQNLYTSVVKTDGRDTKLKQWSQAVASRGGIIKSLINQFSGNIAVPGDNEASTDLRFTDSVQKFQDDGIYELGDKGNKSILKHIQALAVVEPLAKVLGNHTSTLSGAITETNQTTIAVADNSGFVVNQYILVETEFMKVTAIDTSGGNNMTVTRAQNNSTALGGATDVAIGTTVTGITSNSSYVADSTIDASSFEGLTKGTVGENQTFGYEFYLDPNFTSTAVTHKPQAYFNYFERGTRPVLNPTTYGARFELPSTSTTANGAFSETGRLMPMTDFSFERPKGELYTDVDVVYEYSMQDNDGNTQVLKDIVKFELLTVKAATNPEDFIWQNKLISPDIEIDGSPIGMSSEMLQVDISGSWTDIAQMQYINKTKTAGSNISDSSPAYVLISNVQPGIADAHFAEDKVWRGKTSTGDSTTFTIKNRNRTAYGIQRTLIIEAQTGDTPRTLREKVVAALMEQQEQIVRGSFNTYRPPRYYFDSSPSSVTTHSGSDQSLTTSFNVNTYGVKVGMTVVKLDSSGKPSSTYGYISSIPTTTSVRLTWNTGTISASDTVRYYVPVRAGDIVKVRNDLVNVSSDMLVTKSVYTEQPGVANTKYETIGTETNEARGGQAKKPFVARAIDVLSTDEGITTTPPPVASAALSSSTIRFRALDSTTVEWDGGNITFNGQSYTIAAGSTDTTMLTAAEGNTNQSSTPSSANLETTTTADAINAGSGITVSATSMVVDASTKFGAGNYVTIAAEGANTAETVKIVSINTSTHTLTITRGQRGTKASAHGNNAVVNRTNYLDYIIYYPGTGTALKTIRKANFNGLINSKSFLIVAYCKGGYDNSICIPASPNTTTLSGTGLPAEDLFAPYSIGSVLSKKGSQAWSTNIKFEGVDTNTVRWYRVGGGTSTDGSISFGDDTTETILAGNTGDLANSSDGSDPDTHYVYKIVNSDTTAARTLVVTTEYSDVYKDDHVLLATIVLDPNASGSEKPTIFPFNGNVPTFAATAISAQSIKATHFETNLALVNNLLIPNANVGSSQAGIIINSSGIKGYDSASTGVVQFYLDPSSGAGTFGAGKAKLSSTGLVFDDDADSTALVWDNTGNGNIFMYKSSGSDTFVLNTNSDRTAGTTNAAGATTNQTFLITNFNAQFSSSTGVTPTITGANITSSTITATGLTTATFTATSTASLLGDVLLSGTMETDSSPSSNAGVELIDLGGGNYRYELVRDTSSRKYKTNIESLTLDSTKIYDLNPVSFTTKSSNKQAFGLIAEDVYDIIPELVSLVNGEPDSVNYNRLPVLLLAEIKKLKDRIETLENS